MVVMLDPSIRQSQEKPVWDKKNPRKTSKKVKLVQFKPLENELLITELIVMKREGLR